MAKISISEVWEKRKRIRILTVLAGLLVAFSFVGMIIFNNPKKPKAAWDSTNCILTGTGNYSSPATATIGDSTCDGKDVIVNGGGISANGPTAILTVAGARHFKSLIVENGGEITHDALTVAEASLCSDSAGTILDSNQSNYNNSTCINARNKEVNLTVDGNIKLINGGQINVDGKGYPGGQISFPNYVGSSGYGPGGGRNEQSVCDIGPRNCAVTGGGGAYGGNGGASSPDLFFTNPYPLPYTASLNGDFDFGSGGGTAYDPVNGYNAHINGSAGGGRIFIDAKNIYISDQNSKISASGGDGQASSEPMGSYATGGAGSGGTIWIQSAAIISSAGLPISANAGTSSPISQHPLAGIGSIDGVSNNNTSLLNVNANGGSGNLNGGWGGAAGGGGRIVIRFTSNTSTVKKTLMPVSRAGASPANNFNPYALQVGDIIQVKIDVSNLYPNETAEVDDNFLVSTAGVTVTKCVPIAGSYTATPLISGNTLTWQLTADSSGNAETSYNCKVQ